MIKNITVKKILYFKNFRKKNTFFKFCFCKVFGILVKVWKELQVKCSKYKLGKLFDWYTFRKLPN